MWVIYQNQRNLDFDKRKRGRRKKCGSSIIRQNYILPGLIQKIEIIIDGIGFFLTVIFSFQMLLIKSARRKGKTRGISICEH